MPLATSALCSVHHQHTGIILDAIAEEVHDVGPKAFRILIR